LDHSGMLNGTPVTQKEILEKVKAAHWKERMSDTGYKGRRGLPLQTLGEVVKSSLDTYDIGYKSVETVQTLRDKNRINDMKSELKTRLKEFETLGNGIIISHFDQGSYVQELHIPHISPVGGYDHKTDNVTLLDVDPTQPHPYQIHFDTFYKGLSTNYNHALKMYGYSEGGYIYIRLS